MAPERKHAELDIILRWAQAADAFEVTLVYDHPLEAQDYQEFVDAPLRFETAALKLKVGDEEAYGRALSQMMFRDGSMHSFFDRAVTAAGSMPVHLRLLIDPRAPAKYQAIRWESLRDPRLHQRLTTREDVRFSRYLNSPDWTRQVTPLARERNLKALIVVANPSDVADYAPDGPAAAQLAPVDVPKELALARSALGNMSIETLPDDRGGRPTLLQIIDRLRAGVNVLYLVCHGSIEEECSQLYLEDEHGEVDKVSGEAFARRIADVKRQPTIAFLGSCQSAGPGDEYLPSEAGPLSPMGPMLAEAGVAVVVAMQGNVTMTTTGRFMTRFFAELNRDGLADRAMAVARSGVSDRPDWWMPVLFSRLRRGRAWYEPRFGGREHAMFSDLRTRISERNCLPVLGSGIAGEGFLPAREVLADSWVQRRQMPIVAPSRGDLAKVAQYLSVDSGPDMPRTELSSYLRTYLKRENAPHLPTLNWDEDPLQELISEVGRKRRAELGEDDPNAILASLRLAVYVTTSWTKLLEDALTEAGRPPDVLYFDWHRQRQKDDYELPEISPDHPLVYHLFGTIDRPESVVLTEDDYFAWLRAWIKRVDKSEFIPDSVKAALTDRSLLFLGYSLDDWEFRVLFQSIKSFEGNDLLRDRKHVGVQFRPEAVTIDRDSAQDYLERYFGEDRVDIYWGTCSEFLQELRDSKLGI